MLSFFMKAYQVLFKSVHSVWSKYRKLQMVRNEHIQKKKREWERTAVMRGLQKVCEKF